ncbi:MAG: 1-acyl-sn-glycerol-3-phosphate acyltransferase [Leptospiraceae bacterium]|nr:1-acyl-sn-glycerol-3-phosphate acyltransferase [Leptospiraceae bacterium]MCB1320077.1 1-acyl-sn-glycerol-3-phosphate acyltransferase [Leptospiraceae bacterium]
MRITEQIAASPEEQARFEQYLYSGLYDIHYARSLARNVLDFLDKYYFRSNFIGFDTLPERNNPAAPLIYAANHSGMAFPWDAIMMTAGIFKIGSFDMQKAVRALTAPALSNSLWMEPFMIEEFWKRAGAVDATLPNFDIMMRYKYSNVLIYPEGVPGIGKGFDRRYQLQRFSTSFIRMAIKYQTDIVPIAVVNGEFINPYSYKSDEINKLANKLGIPFVPIGPTTSLVPFQAWSFYFGLPARLTYVMGKRIKVYEMTDKPLERLKKKELHEIRNVVQFQMQAELTAAEKTYGQDPYQLEELGDLWRDNLDKILYIIPSGWPLLFLEHERRFKKEKDFRMEYGNDSFFGALFQNPMALSYVLPVIGWPMLLRWKNII